MCGLFSVLIDGDAIGDRRPQLRVQRSALTGRWDRFQIIRSAEPKHADV
jgi:hypothetical protein